MLPRAPDINHKHLYNETFSKQSSSLTLTFPKPFVEAYRTVFIYSSEGKRETFSLFLNNISSFKKQIFTLKGFSNQQVDYFAEHNIKIDFLFIDGDHTYNAVREDFLLYRKYLHPEATIILHDYGASGVRKVIDQYIKDQVKWEYILPNMYCCQLRNLP